MSQAIYQTNGKPLSQQAIYQQKLKQGIYGGPGGPSVGVNSNASDTAALLAASADLTVKPSYERIVAQEAHTAALAARTDTIQSWTRERTDPQADAAASNARASTLASTTPSNYTLGTGVPSYNGDSLYRAANQNSSATMTSRIHPDKDSKRSGLTTKSTVSSLNIGKISSVANKNSSKSLNSRLNPSLDYRSGLNSQHKPSESFTASQVVNSTLLSAASSRANDRLKSISSVGSPDDFKAQAQAYANALQIAQKNSEERIKANNAGLINLGGGLTMENSEVIKMASLIVQPVLKDLDSKAGDQREADISKKNKLAELEEIHRKAKSEDAQKKSEERVALENAKNERIQKHEERKGVEDANYAEHQEERNKEVEAKALELKETETEHEDEKQALLTEKQENQDRIDSEEDELIASRKEELDNLQAEKDELLKPVLDELEVETSNLEKLQGERDELSKDVTTSEELNQEYEAKVTELNEKIEAIELEIEESTKKLEELTANHESTSTEVENLQIALDEHTKEAEISHKDLDSKIEELTKQKDESHALKDSKKQEIYNLLDDAIKDEHKINGELPEHLRSDVNESKLRDVGSLFSLEHDQVEESKEEPPTPIEENPKVSKVAKKSTTSDPSPKKKSGFRRLSKIFSSGEKKIPSASTVKSKATETVNTVPKEKEVKKEVKKEDKAALETSNPVDDDEISLNQKKNQGGLFKEEI